MTENPLRAFRAKYGKSGSTKTAINRAIRAEIPAGAAILDLLDLSGKIAQRTGWKDATGAPSVAAVFHDRLCAIVDDLADEIARRYGFASRDEADA